MVRLPPLGLCAGGGGAWGGLKVEGLEKALLAQVRVLRRWWDLVEKMVGSDLLIVHS